MLQPDFYQYIVNSSEAVMDLAAQRGMLSGCWSNILDWHSKASTTAGDYNRIKGLTNQLIFPLLDNFNGGKKVATILINRKNAAPVVVTRELTDVPKEEQVEVNMSDVVGTFRMMCEKVGIDVENFIPPQNPVAQYMVK